LVINACHARLGADVVQTERVPMTNDLTEDAHQRASSDLLGSIRESLPTLSRTQAKIATAILNSPRLFVEKPIEDLVPWIGVSAPTITRFCRSMGCDGLRDLKLKVMGAMQVGARYLEHSERPTTFEGMLEQATARAQNGILDAARVPQDAIEAAIDRLLAARVVYAFGSGGVSSWLIDEIQNRLFRLGVTVVPCRDGVMQSMIAATTGHEDVILCCSLGGNNRAELEAIHIGQEYGGFCIALCPPDTQMQAAADLGVPVETHDDGDVLGPTSARYAMLLTIDLIAFGTAMRSRAIASESLRRLKQQFVSHIEPDNMRPLAD
jgi:DNA-binding MurR/RpiR family transcriptional regulator